MDKRPEMPGGHRYVGVRNPSVTAVEFVRKVRGASQPVILKCSDDKFYLVKMHENPAGSHVLANEFIGSTLALAVGLSVPNYEVVHMSEDFIMSNPALWFEGPKGRYPPTEGFHFGSSFMNYEWARRIGIKPSVGEYVGSWRIPDIVNRQEFLAMLILDVFANKQTPRKALFVGDRLLRAYFVDHGHVLDENTVDNDEGCNRCLHSDLALYEGLWDWRVVARHIEQLRTLTEVFLTNPLKFIPYEWYAGREATDNLYLYRRLDAMPEMMKPYEEMLTGGCGATASVRRQDLSVIPRTNLSPVSAIYNPRLEVKQFSD